MKTTWHLILLTETYVPTDDNWNTDPIHRLPKAHQCCPLYRHVHPRLSACSHPPSLCPTASSVRTPLTRNPTAQSLEITFQSAEAFEIHPFIFFMSYILSPGCIVVECYEHG